MTTIYSRPFPLVDPLEQGQAFLALAYERGIVPNYPQALPGTVKLAMEFINGQVFTHVTWLDLSGGLHEQHQVEDLQDVMDSAKRF